MMECVVFNDKNRLLECDFDRIVIDEFWNKSSRGEARMHDYIEKAYVPEKNNFIFIDEVQMCSDFEKAINSFHASEKYDIYITGSNAFLLSNDLATLFTGRTFEID